MYLPVQQQTLQHGWTSVSCLLSPSKKLNGEYLAPGSTAEVTGCFFWCTGCSLGITTVVVLPCLSKLSFPPYDVTQLRSSHPRWRRALWSHPAVRRPHPVPRSPRRGDGEGRLLAFCKGLGNCGNARQDLLMRDIRSLQTRQTGWGFQLDRKLPIVRIELLTILRFII